MKDEQMTDHNEPVVLMPTSKTDDSFAKKCLKRIERKFGMDLKKKKSPEQLEFIARFTAAFLAAWAANNYQDACNRINGIHSR